MKHADPLSTLEQILTSGDPTAHTDFLEGVGGLAISHSVLPLPHQNPALALQ